VGFPVTNIYQRKPETVFAKYWDGSRKGYHEIKKWMTPFLLESSGPYCQYWDEYDEPPLTFDPDASVYTNAQLYDYAYRTIQFYAWDDDQEMEPNSWVLFYDSERNNTKHYSIKSGKFMSDIEFQMYYEPVIK
jgi:hypothetical protein